MIMSRSAFGRSSAVCVWNLLGMLPRKSTMVGFTAGSPHAMQTMGKDSVGASTSRPVMSFMFVCTAQAGDVFYVRLHGLRKDSSHAAAAIDPCWAREFKGGGGGKYVGVR